MMPAAITDVTAFEDGGALSLYFGGVGERVRKAAEYGASLGLVVNAGHGLNYHNVQDIARIPQIAELNIGHAIIGQAVFVGLERAVKEMRALMIEARMASRLA